MCISLGTNFAILTLDIYFDYVRKREYRQRELNERKKKQKKTTTNY